MTSARIEGELHRNADGTLHGWCWAPDRPTERVVVDLLINDGVVAAIVAARFRQDLADRGAGDGRHAFSIRLPRSAFEVTGGLVISARERASGTVFGRVVREMPSLRADLVPRLDAGSDQVAALWESFAASQPRQPPSVVARLRPAFAELAARLRAHGASLPPAAVALQALRQGAIALPLVADPAVSVVLPGLGSAAGAVRRIAALVPALHDLRAELVLADTARDPEFALLPAAVAHLRYARAEGLAAALNAAGAAARGAVLAFLTGAEAAPVALSHAAPAVLLGPAASSAWLRLAAGEGMAQEAPPGDAGLLACIPATLFAATGGFDAAMADDPAVMAVDLALKARMLGAPVALSRARWQADEPGADMPAPAAALSAAGALRARWGACA